MTHSHNYKFATFNRESAAHVKTALKETRELLQEVREGGEREREREGGRGGGKRERERERGREGGRERREGGECSVKVCSTIFIRRCN